MNKLLVIRKKVEQAGSMEIRFIICERYDIWVNESTAEKFLIIYYSDTERTTVSCSQFELIYEETL